VTVGHPTVARARLLAEGKSPLMYLAVILFYLACAVAFNPRLVTLIAEASGLAAVVIALFAAHLNAFWLLGGYYLMLGLFTAVDRATRRKPPPAVREGPAVAVLYTTMNDFQERAALSCLRQAYSPCHLFILDDSVDPALRTAVDSFAAEHPGEVTVIRRADREGYKAGSLNSALRNQVRGFELFLVVDADSVLPESFTAELVPYFDLAEDIGWVQASHAPNPVQKTAFARDLGLGILPLWEVYYGPRNRFGNVIFLGHGGLIRYDVWKKVGGFPEILAEDLAFSTRAAHLGYRGYFAPQVVSYEDFPEGYRQLRRQQAKYVTGVCQYLHQECLPYLRSPNVKWFEKMDVLMSCASLFAPTLVLTFMIVFCVLLPLVSGVWQPITLSLAGYDLVTVPVVVLSDGFGGLWTWGYFVVTGLCTVAPVLGCFSVMARHPLRGTKMFLVSGIPYLSLLVMATATVISYVVSRRAVFLVTGDRWGVDPKSFPQGFSPTSGLAERLGAEDKITRWVEVALGATFAVLCVMTFNVSLLAFALSLGLGPMLLRVPWDTPLLRPLLFLPFLLIGCGLLLGGMSAATAQGAFMPVFFFHF
jgi:cellulose synthase/poly-beta-1,6-N-acetylglucosamine synthase-like glycosyltransferase